MFSKSILKSYSGVINILSRFTDPLAVVIAALLSFSIRFNDYPDLPQSYRSLVLFAVLCVFIVFPLFGMYASWRGKGLLKQARAIILAWLTVVLMMIVILFGLKISSDFSRLWLGSWMILGLFLLLLFRLVIYAFLQYQRYRGRNYRRVIVMGAGGLASRLISQAILSPWAGFKIEALFDDNKNLIGSHLHGLPVIGTGDDIESYMSRNQVDELWIALPLRAEQRVKELLFSLRHHTVNIKFIPDIFGFSLLNHSLTEVVGVPAVNLSETPMGGSNQIIKAVEDKVLGGLIIVFISPVLVAIAILIKVTSPGPVLFKQRRHGWDGRVINVYKFRTMKLHREVDGSVTQATVNDARVTKFGQFLRRTSLDELPQFYNVLQGRMSIVGPRPHAVQHTDLYKDQVDRYMLRHMVKPGITGWAQVNGLRGETDTLEKMQKRIEYDLYYIENWSLWFDLKIIWLTIFRGFINKNAY